MKMTLMFPNGKMFMNVFLIILLAIISVLLNEEYSIQFAPQQGNATDFTTDEVTSDFARRVGNFSKWRSF